MPSPEVSASELAWRTPLTYPIVLRRSSSLRAERRPHKNRISSAWSPWPTVGEVPATGDYVVITTWREVIDAAMTAGCNAFGWLAAVFRASLLQRSLPVVPRWPREDREPYVGMILGTNFPS